MLAPLQLTQIKTGYAARWRDLVLSVEAESLCWTLRVQLPGEKKPLYQAYRSSADRAKASAAEFAALHVLGAAGADTAAQLAGSIAWQQHW